MKIAYLTNQYPMSSLTFIRREIEAMEDHGIDVSRFAIRSWSEEVVDEADRAETAKTRVILGVGIGGLLWNTLAVAARHPLRFARAFWLALSLALQSHRGIMLHLAHLAEACVLVRWLTDSPIDWIHAHFGTNSSTVTMLCRVLGGPPYSFTVHGPEVFDNVLGYGLGEKIARAGFVCAISSYCRAQLFRHCDPLHWSKIHIVRCGLDDMFLSCPYEPVPEENRFVSVGRLSEQKGQLVLVEAASRLLAEGFAFRLVIIGDGPFRDVLEARIRERGLERHVDLFGWASNAEVRRQILGSKAMVLPSFAEGLPVVIMEALALGRPVLSTYIAGIPELVEPGECGWLVPSGSVEDLVDAMREVLHTPTSRLNEMGRAGMERVALRHSARAEAETLLDLFKSHSRDPQS